MHTPIRRSASIFSLPWGELARVFAQGVGFCGLAYLALALFGILPPSVNLLLPVLEPAPEPVDSGDGYELPAAPENAAAAPATRTLPSHVSIPAIGVDADVRVPGSVDVTTLDHLLSLGAVYYPGSGSLEAGNVFIFGHSTNWSVVRNQAYKTFNDLDKLQPGDYIYLDAGGQTATYEVENVRVAPDSEVLVSFAGDDRRLTLSTCNTFGQKAERIVVEARAVGGIDDSQ